MKGLVKFSGSGGVYGVGLPCNLLRSTRPNDREIHD